MIIGGSIYAFIPPAISFYTTMQHPKERCARAYNHLLVDLQFLSNKDVAGQRQFYPKSAHSLYCVRLYVG